MKSNYRYDKIFVITGLMMLLFSCKTKTEKSASEHSGHDMGNMSGMEMKKEVAGETHKMTVNIDDLIQPVNQNIISQVSTFHPVKSKQNISVKAHGVIEYDHRRFTNVASRVTGRIESTNVKFQFQPVKKGQLLFTIYSPELVSVQQEFLLQLANDAGNKTLLDATRQKLLLLGVSAEQIAAVERNKKSLMTISVFATQSGYVITGNGKQTIPAMKSSTSSMSGDMSGDVSTGAENSVPANNEPIVREGQYVNKGETVFRIVNTEMVWGMLKIFPDDVSKIKIGSSAEIEFDGGEHSIDARIDFIEKYFSETDKTVTARVYLSNQNFQLKIGDLISSNISCGDKEAIWIPRSSVIDIGNAQVVFVRKGNVFKATEIHTGLINGENMELLSGISETDEIAVNAEYLVDSEAFIRKDKP